MAVAPWIVSDALWERIEPLLPKVERRFRFPGRRRLSDREAQQRSCSCCTRESPGGHLPLELGFGSGSTCYRCLNEWERAGVRERLHALLLGELRTAVEIEWSRAVADSNHVQAKKGAPRRARARLMKRIQAPPPGRVERNPARLDGHRGNPNDVTQLIPLLERIPAVPGRVGRPRRRPERLTADRGYDHDKYRRELRRRRITPEIARRQSEHGSGLGRVRWVVERTFAWLPHFKRLLVLRPSRRDPLDARSVNARRR